MDSFQVRRAGAFLTLLADTLRCSCRRAPRGAAPSRRLGARQPGRCDAPRSFTMSFYRWKTRHRVGHQPAHPCHPASAIALGAGDADRWQLLRTGPGHPRQGLPVFCCGSGGWALLCSGPAAPHPGVLSSQPRRRKPLRGQSTAGVAGTPAQKDSSLNNLFIPVFTPFLNFSPVRPGYFKA